MYSGSSQECGSRQEPPAGKPENHSLDMGFKVRINVLDN
jgi:hypothetical protein